MVAAGQNLKRLIKHKLSILFSSLKKDISETVFLSSPDFFNRLVSCTTCSWSDHIPLICSPVGGPRRCWI
jgi:hypothetical protein